MLLAKDDHIEAAWAEHASGPGWSNSIVQVLVRSSQGELRLECLQPSEQSAEIHTLFTISEVTARTMKKAVERILKFSLRPS